MTIVARTEGESPATARAAQRTVWSVDPAHTLDTLRSMDQVLHDDLAGARVPAQMLAAFAGLALLLAAAGIYGIVSYSVAQRTREIGIRVALGARKADVLRLVVGQGFVPVLAGVAVGLIGGAGLSRVMSALLYGLSPSDPVTFLGLSAALAIVALLASWVPARRAARVDPTVALRHE